MAPLVPLPISPAGSWWWLRTTANATLPGGASPRAAPPGAPAAALLGSQTTRHSPSRRTGSAASWAHPIPRTRSIRAKDSLGLGVRPCSQCRFPLSMAEWLCDPQVLLSSSPLLLLSVPALLQTLNTPCPAPQPSLCVSLSPGLSISLSIPLRAPQLCPASYSCCHCSSLLLGRAQNDSSWALGGRGGMKQPDRRATARTLGRPLWRALKAGTGTPEIVCKSQLL